MLCVERGVLTLGQQMAFQREWNEIRSAAESNGALHNPVTR